MNYVFGPVLSRRLGFSLGVDIIPYKTCSLDCIYCECGSTTFKTMQRKVYIPETGIIQEVKDYFSEKETEKNIDFITIYGSGEPLLHSRLDVIITEIKKLVDIPLAVLTNGVLMYKREVRKELSKADLILPSLDTGIEETFRLLCRPHLSVKLEKIIESYILFRKEYPHISFWLEIMFVKGINDDEENVKKLVDICKDINPDRIQLNTAVRPSAEKNVSPLSNEELENIRNFFGPKAEIIGIRKKHSKHMVPLTPKKIFELIKRRPVTSSELLKVTGMDLYIITSVVKILENQKKIKRTVHNGEEFFARL